MSRLAIRPALALLCALALLSLAACASPAKANVSPTAIVSAATATATHVPRPDATLPPSASSRPTATPAPCDAPCNPWGYDFTPNPGTGYEIVSPPTDFCVYFDCVINFWDGTGYVVECRDGMFSLSGGRPDVCSNDGGYWRTLYEH